MLSRLTELGMKDSYDDVIEYAISFLSVLDDRARGIASGSSPR